MRTAARGMPVRGGAKYFSRGTRKHSNRSKVVFWGGEGV